MTFIKHFFLFLINYILSFVLKPISLLFKNCYSHKSEYIYLKHAGFVKVDLALITYIKKLNELGYKTYGACQGEEYFKYKNRFSLFKNTEIEGFYKEHAYIIAEDFPKELIQLFEENGLKIEDVEYNEKLIKSLINKKVVRARNINSGEFIFILRKWYNSLEN
tara:strand:- start:18749 stop:19237 length:489 start_codon:yes stop_codon:yes gene_type:complete